MDNTRVPDELLSELAAMCGCTYLSDLRRQDLRPAVLAAITRIPPDKYPARAIGEALRYVFSDNAQDAQ